MVLMFLKVLQRDWIYAIVAFVNMLLNGNLFTPGMHRCAGDG